MYSGNKSKECYFSVSSALQTTTNHQNFIFLKLNSIPELRELDSLQPVSISEPTINQLEDSQPKTETTAEPIVAVSNSASKPVESMAVDESPKVPNVDPALLKYRKMLQFGVPKGAVELKMINDGLDPKLL